MQFGILLGYPFTVLSDLASIGTVYQWIALALFYLQSLSSSIKGQAEVSANEFKTSHVLLERLLTLNCCYLLSIGQISTKSTKYQYAVYWLANMSFTVPLVIIFTKFDGQIASEFVNLTDSNAKDEDKWESAREIAEITFQKVYLPKVLDAKYPPKAYVRLEGENCDRFLLKKRE